MNATNHELDQAFNGVLGVLHPQDQQSLRAFHQERPDLAREAVRETAEVLMKAKCLEVVPDDADFTQACAPLVALAMQHPAVGRLFESVAAADLADGANDPLFNPAMKTIVAERIERVKACLG